MKNPQLIASSNPQARANPMVWDGEEAAEGVFLDAGSDDPLALLGTPALVLPEAPRLPDNFEPSPRLRHWLAELQRALGAAAAGEPLGPLDTEILDSESIQAVVEILGDGEVHGKVELDGVRYDIREAVLPGIWRLLGDDGSHRVEVAGLPGVVLEAASSLSRAPFAVPPAGGELMNAPAVLTEISDRGAHWSAGDDAHVINLTLLPMSEGDQLAVRECLGKAALEMESGGFGNCRVYATRFRHIWAVQYLNALGHIILDTLEIGGPPGAILAAKEDFEDSGARLGEILETYLL